MTHSYSQVSTDYQSSVYCLLPFDLSRSLPPHDELPLHVATQYQVLLFFRTNPPTALLPQKKHQLSSPNDVANGAQELQTLTSMLRIQLTHHPLTHSHLPTRTRTHALFTITLRPCNRLEQLPMPDTIIPRIAGTHVHEKKEEKRRKKKRNK